MIILLVCIGCLSLYSAAGGDWNPWANRHFQRSIIGFSLAFAIAITDINIIYKYAWIPFIISIIFGSLGKGTMTFPDHLYICFSSLIISSLKFHAPKKA